MIGATQYLGNLDTAEVSEEVMGGGVTHIKRKGSYNISPIKEVTTVEMTRRYRITRDAHRVRTRRTPGRRSEHESMCLSDVDSVVVELIATDVDA